MAKHEWPMPDEHGEIHVPADARHMGMIFTRPAMFSEQGGSITLYRPHRCDVKRYRETWSPR